MITDLRLQNFRSYSDASFEISQGVNIIVGPNASGKTNLLEAILVIARGKSYRAKDIDLINFKKPWSRLDADLNNNTKRTVKIITEPETTKTFEIDNKNFKRLSIQHSLPIVLFEPNHLLLLSGGPERRRDYLDDLLEQIIAGYGEIIRQYKRTLVQRNALLKKHNPNLKNQIFPWDLRLSQLGGQIVNARHGLVEKINKDLAKTYKKISGSNTSVKTKYITQGSVKNYESQLLKKLENSLENDKIRGFTSWGPHRDDLEVLFNERPAQDVASRGELRTAILALKIIELKTLEEALQKTPIILLDDVFSELDGKRRHALTDFLAPYQTFITTTDADIILKNFTQKSNVIALS